MKKYGIIFLLCILFLGFILRRNNYLTWPREGATFDEYAWTWLGMNIVQQHIPISWSPHPQYKIRTHYISPKGTRFWLVQPYLEHPPLFGMVAGSYALMSGAKDMYAVDLQHIRGLGIILGVLSIGMVFLLARELYDLQTGLFASLLFATIPTIVVGSRLVQNENFFIPGLLFVLLCITKYIKTSNQRFFYWGAAVSGLLVLAKVPWWAAAVSSVLILCSQRKYKMAAVFFGIVLSFFSLYFLWGFYWDAEVFKNLWNLQLNRYDITFDGIYGLFTNPLLADRAYLDGWIIVGWVTLFMCLQDVRKHGVILLGLLGYFAIYILAIPNEPGHGWYRYPFYPFLIIAFSTVFLDEVRKRSLFVFFSIALIGVSLLQHTWNPTFGFSYGLYRLFLVCSGLTGLPLFFEGIWAKRISRFSTVFLMTMLLLLNVWSVFLYNEQ